jgi:wyosine [tRNA(Phe)-imidazoG37] synthetase (radical SAM superfamily)
VHLLTVRRCFVEPEALRRELAQVGNVPVDTVTFSGVGEPTLALNLAELVAVGRETLPGRPVAILTNASLISREDVRRDLALFDVVVAKLDAASEKLFRQINRPFISSTLADIVVGLRQFRRAFGGKLALQMMFVEANRKWAVEMAALARSCTPDEAQLKPDRDGRDRGRLCRAASGERVQSEAAESNPAGRDRDGTAAANIGSTTCSNSPSRKSLI